jgi:hypothetical protein
MTTHYQLLVPLKLARVYVAWVWHNRLPQVLADKCPQLFDKRGVDPDAQVDLTPLVFFGREAPVYDEYATLAQRLAAVQYVQGGGTPSCSGDPRYDWSGISLNKAVTTTVEGGVVWEPIQLGD